MQSVTEILSDEGSLVDLIEGFKSREQQQTMAEAIVEVLDDHESLICEAGTGTGKTFAYLIPVIMHHGKAIISMATKPLQDQLFHKDLPVILKALAMGVNVSLLKGRGNYLCLHRMQHAERDHQYLSNTALSQLHQVKDWSTETNNGDLSELKAVPETSRVRGMVTSTVENCLGTECDFYDECFVYKARRHAADADLVVVNHHLFLSDLRLRETGYGELLPTADVVVFDEAHKLPELASEFFSQTISTRQIFELIHDSKTAYFTQAADMPQFLESLDKLDKSVRDLRLCFGKGEVRSAWHELKSNPEVEVALTDLLARGDEVHQGLEQLSERGKLLDNCYERFTAILNGIGGYLDVESKEQVQWLETRGNSLFFHQTPLDIAETFKSYMQVYDSSNIFTSATLSVDMVFDHFVNQLGQDEVKTLALDSSFDFQNQTLLYQPDELPDPRTEGYTELVVEKAIPILKLTRGRAFFLFTSHRALQIAAGMLLDYLDYPVMVQGDMPRTELLENFRDTPNSVLLGTSSFWEGVDVRGQALSCVIIDKLPFASPGDPVLKARLQKMEEQGGNPFMHYQLPEAVISLKQGVGRLIRDHNDYGLLMICDPRLKTKSYGKIFLKSLPTMKKTSSLEDVEAFFRHHETDHVIS